MKKIFIYSILFFSIFSFFTSNLAFADDNNNDQYKHYRKIKAQNYYNEAWKKMDKYNMRKTTNQDVVFDNQEGILNYVKLYNERFDPVLGRIVIEDNVNNEFHPLQSFWGAVCDQKSRKFYGELTVQKLDQACKAHFKGAKSLMSVNHQKNNTSVSADLLVYTGNKDIEFSFKDSGFFSQPLDRSEEKDFIQINARISIPSDWKERTKQYNSIELQAFNPQFINFNYGSEFRLFGLMGKPKDVEWLSYAPLYNQFKVVYPDDFNAENKPLSDIEDSITQKNKSKFWPYFSYKVSKMNLNGFIIAIDNKGKEPFQITQVRPYYELYNEDKSQKIFSYAGDSLLDNFNYDFEEKGTYWVKTSIQAKPPLLGFGQNVEVIQPVWTKVLINGESYEVANTSFDKNSNVRCDGQTCDVPAFASDCAALNPSNFGDFIRCSFNKIDTKSRERFGVLYSPVRFSQDIIGRLSNINAVSCTIRIHNYNASLCFIQERTPQLYTVMTILSNGVILFGFSIYIYKQALHFFAGDGEDN